MRSTITRGAYLALTLASLLSLHLTFAQVEPQVERRPLGVLLREPTTRLPQQLPTTTTTTATTTTTTTATGASISATATPQFQVLRAPKARCQVAHQNKSYPVGARWNEDCEQVCECVTSDESGLFAISACRPRCPTYKDPPGEGCALVRSKLDECCLDWQCDTEGKLAPTTTTTTTNTERGSLTVSTTDIRLPSSSSPTAAAATTLSPISTTSSIAVEPVPTTTTLRSRSRTPISNSPAFTVTAPPTTLPVSLGVPTATSTRRPPTTTRQPETTRLPSIALTSDVTTTRQALTRQVSSSAAPPLSSSISPEALVTGTSYPAATGNQLSPRESGLRMLQPEQAQPVESATDTTTYEEVALDSQDTCLVFTTEPADLTVYKLGQNWTESCNQSCRCAFTNDPLLPNDVERVPTRNLNKVNPAQTEIRCGLPPKCSYVFNQMASPSCKSPQLVYQRDPQDLCACPKVMCANLLPVRTPVVSTLLTSTTTNQPKIELQGCRPANGKVLSFNETFNDECHSICRCEQDGEVHCQQFTCPELPPPDATCAEYIFNPNFRPNSDENNCCPELLCKSPRDRMGCQMFTRWFDHGQKLPEEVQPRDLNDSCQRECTCLDGKIHCTPICPNDALPNDSDCENWLKIEATDGDCCPRWTCQIEEYKLASFEVKPLNISSAESTLDLPRFALGYSGHIEVNYTGLPTTKSLGLKEPPADSVWFRRPKIRTHDSIFHNRTIKFFVNNLQAGYTYWFKVQVHFHNASEPMDTPLESVLLNMSMPDVPDFTGDSFSTPTLIVPTTIKSSNLAPTIITPVASVPTTTTTTTTTTSTTTTTPPPTRILQPVQPHPTIQQLVPSTIISSTTPSSTTTTTTTEQPSSTSSSTTSTTSERPRLSETPVVSTTIASTSSSSVPSTTISNLHPPVLHKQEDPLLINDKIPPCSKTTSIDSNELDAGESLPWTEQIQTHINAPLQRYAWHLLVALSIMTILFTVVLYLYLKKPTSFIPSTSQGAYDNPTFAKFSTYYVDQPHVKLVDENNQNFHNDAIIAQLNQSNRHKNQEADKTSPLQQHSHFRMDDVYHQNNRLI